jgi:nucleoside phosphorylase
MNDDETTLFLDNAPLPQTATSVDLAIHRLEDSSSRGETIETTSFQSKIPEGKITFDNASIQLFALPPQRSTAAFSLAPDRTVWDLYLAIIPFTLNRPTTPRASYSRVTFMITLHTSQATALDLFPQNILSPIENKKFTISPDGRFSTASASDHGIEYFSLLPNIYASGVGTSTFYWTFTGDNEKKSVPCDTKQVLAVLRVPRGTTLIEGEVNYRIDVKKPLLRLAEHHHTKVDPYAIRLSLHDLRPFSTKNTQENTQPEISSVDACLVCALSEEVTELIRMIEEQCQVHFEEGYDKKLRRDYQHVSITNKDGEPLHILVTWLPNPGSPEAIVLVDNFIREYRPRMVGMTGLCGGDRQTTVLGDIIVADCAFPYDAGRVELDEQGQKRFLPNVKTWQIQPGILHTLRMFNNWETAIKQVERPSSLRQQRDWLLATLFDKKYQSISSIPEAERVLHAPQWRQIWQQELRAWPASYLTPKGTLTESALRGLAFSEDFPYQDPPHSRRHIGPVATGNNERADDPFPEIKRSVQGTLALDREGAAFYRAMADFPATPALLVKGVSDHADAERDDRFRPYAARVSALYMLSFIRTYLTTGRFTRPQ